MLGVRVGAQVVIAGHARRPAQLGLVGQPRPAENVEHREADRDEDAGQDAEQRHAEEGRDADGELHPTAAPQQRGPRRSASDSDAAITTAASAGCGRSRSSPGTKSSISRMSAAPTTPVSWLRAPDCSATGGHGQETAAFTSSTTFFSTAGLHF